MCRVSIVYVIKDIGDLHYFYGVEVQQLCGGIFLCQTQYAKEVLECVKMINSNSISTPMTIKSWSSSLTDHSHDPIYYKSIVRKFQYPTFIRHDQSYSVNLVCQFIHQSTMGHFQMEKRILFNVQGTMDYRIHILNRSTFNLCGFSDADQVGFPITRQSISGYCSFLKNNCIIWNAKKQHTISHSSAKAEYHSLASTSKELTWILFILRDIGICFLQPLVLFCDNISTLCMIINPIFHTHTKHTELDYHFFHEKVALVLFITKFVHLDSPSNKYCHWLKMLFVCQRSNLDFCSIAAKFDDPDPMMQTKNKHMDTQDSQPIQLHFFDFLLFRKFSQTNLSLCIVFSLSISNSSENINYRKVCCIYKEFYCNLCNPFI